jgi:hypothetical protein
MPRTIAPSRELHIPAMSAELTAAYETVRVHQHRTTDAWCRNLPDERTIIENETSGWPADHQPLVRVLQYLDPDQAQSLMSGEPFKIGPATFRAGCRSQIHLQMSSPSDLRIIRQQFDYELLPGEAGPWHDTPFCCNGLDRLWVLDDHRHQSMVNKYDYARGWNGTDQTAGAAHLMHQVCLACLDHATRLYTGRCAHQQTPAVCDQCDAELIVWRNAVIEQVVSEVEAALSPQSVDEVYKLADLRAHPEYETIRSSVRRARDGGLRHGEIGHALGLHVATVTKLLA